MWWPFKRRKTPIEYLYTSEGKFNPDNYALIGGNYSHIQETVKIKTRKFKKGYRMKDLDYFKHTYHFKYKPTGESVTSEYDLTKGDIKGKPIKGAGG